MDSAYKSIIPFESLLLDSNSISHQLIIILQPSLLIQMCRRNTDSTAVQQSKELAQCNKNKISLSTSGDLLLIYGYPLRPLRLSLEGRDETARNDH